MSPRQFDPDTPEWMDLDQPVSPELERDLENLQTLNRWFGSHSLVLHYLDRWLQPDQPWRILDLATGAGDIPVVIARRAAALGIAVEFDAVDRQASTLAIAQKRSAIFPNIRFHQGDIRTFGAGETWDVVLCSLALHHFSRADAVAILRHMRELTTRYALAADLRRCTLGTIGVDLLTACWMREPMTRNDARASVRRAFSYEEFADLGRDAGWQDARHARHFCFRQALAIDTFRQ